MSAGNKVTGSPFMRSHSSRCQAALPPSHHGPTPQRPAIDGFALTKPVNPTFVLRHPTGGGYTILHETQDRRAPKRKKEKKKSQAFLCSSLGPWFCLALLAPLPRPSCCPCRAHCLCASLPRSTRLGIPLALSLSAAAGTITIHLGTQETTPSPILTAPSAASDGMTE